jgi:cystathionine beta-lyase
MDWRTKILNPQPLTRTDFNSLNTPVYRGSTVVFDKQGDVNDDWKPSKAGFSYGLYGTPTSFELAARISLIEKSHYTFIVPGGQAAIALVYFSFCKSGDHVLVPFSAYGPNKEMANGLLRGLGIDVEEYDPELGRDIKGLIKKNTSLIWCESPGSVTMEIQDVSAIVDAAKGSSAYVAIDNTYAAGVLFDAFGQGVDVSIQALTKYVGGHSDLLLGSVSVRAKAHHDIVGPIYRQLGMAVSPDDCSLALRGLQTLAIRLEHLQKATLKIAHWLNKNKLIDIVLHPALPSCPGHIYWKRDFNGSASVFSILFKEKVSPIKVEAFLNALKIFKIGLSWGGVTSLAVVYPKLDRPNRKFGGRLVRLNIGLENPNELILDLKQAMEVAKGTL